MSTPVVKQQHYAIEQDPEKLDIPQYIDRPEYVRNRKAGYTLQILGWFIWIWLLLPIVSVLFWIYQAVVIHQHVVVQPVQDQFYNLQLIGSAILIMIFCLLLWAGYNWLRFRNRERRKIVNSTTRQEFAAYFSIDLNDLVDMQQGKIITLHYDDQGELVEYEISI